MDDPVSGTGSGQSITPPPSDQNQDQQPADINFFPNMPFTPDEYKRFMQQEFKFLGQSIQHDMKRMKKAMEKMKRSMEENS